MLTIHVCVGSACHLKGSYNVINKLQKIINDKNLGDMVTVKAAFCLGECTKAVTLKVGDNPVQSVDERNLNTFFEEYILNNLY